MAINLQIHQVVNVKSETTYFPQADPKHSFYVRRLTLVSNTGDCLTVELFASTAEALAIPDSAPTTY
jgi:hypothetical protein